MPLTLFQVEFGSPRLPVLQCLYLSGDEVLIPTPYFTMPEPILKLKGIGVTLLMSFRCLFNHADLQG